MVAVTDHAAADNMAVLDNVEVADVVVLTVTDYTVVVVLVADSAVVGD